MRKHFSPEQLYWNWHNSEPLADGGVDHENVAPGPRFWERMLEAGKQAVADRKEERELAATTTRGTR